MSYFKSNSPIGSVHICNSHFSLDPLYSSASSRDLYLMAPPWKKPNLNHRRRLRLRRQAELPEPKYLAIWLQRRNAMEHVGKMKKQLKRHVEERPLELHCAALDEDKNPKISKQNECFLFLTYVLSVDGLGLIPNRTFFFPQCLKAFMRLRNKKVTEKQMQTAVGLYMQSRRPSGVIWWIFCAGEFCTTFHFGANEFWYMHCLATCSMRQPGAVNSCLLRPGGFFFFFIYMWSGQRGFRWKRLPGSAKGYIVCIFGERRSVTTDWW